MLPGCRLNQRCGMEICHADDVAKLVPFSKWGIVAPQSGFCPRRVVCILSSWLAACIRCQKQSMHCRNNAESISSATMGLMRSVSRVTLALKRQPIASAGVHSLGWPQIHLGGHRGAKVQHTGKDHSTVAEVVSESGRSRQALQADPQFLRSVRG